MNKINDDVLLETLDLSVRAMMIAADVLDGKKKKDIANTHGITTERVRLTCRMVARHVRRIAMRASVTGRDGQQQE